MSTPITEAHIDLVKNIWAGLHSQSMTFTPCAQLIADSEAAAVAQWSGGLDQSLPDLYEAAKAERDQLRVDCENETKWAAHYLADAQNAKARAERAEASLHALRLVCGTTDADKFSTWVDRANARAEKAEAELANIRALANRRNKQDHSHDTTHQLVASLDQSLDIVQAELVEERWLKGCAIKRSQELLSELAAERARLDWLMAGGVCMMQATGGFYISRLHAHVSRAIVDAAMKEGAK